MSDRPETGHCSGDPLPAEGSAGDSGDESSGDPGDGSAREASSRSRRSHATRRAFLALTPAVVSSLAGCSWGASGSGSPSGTRTDGQPQTDTPGTASSPTGQATDGPPPTGNGTDTTTTQPTSTDRPTSTTPEPPLDRFDRVVDAVADAGCDPTGETPCGRALERVVTDGVVIRFPDGRYRFERGHGFRGLDRLGFVGEGDVTFVPPPGFNDKLIELSGNWMRFTGIDIDVRARDTTAGIRVITREGFEIEDVTFRGRGTHPDESVTNALALAVQESGGEGSVRNVVARRGSAIGHYKRGNGRVGIWVGRRHNGTVTLADCRLEEFGNNGIYASRGSGSTKVVGGSYRNNNVASIRLGGPDSSVTGATVAIDVDRYQGPPTRQDRDFNTRAIVVEQGPNNESGRVVVEDCTVDLTSAVRSQGGLVAWTTGNGPLIDSCRFTTALDGVAAIRGQPPVNRVSTEDRAFEIRDTVITGGAAQGPAIDLRDRPGSTIEGVEVVQTGPERDGIRLLESDPLTVASTSVSVTRFPLLAMDPRGDDGRCLVDVRPGSTLERSVSSPDGTRSFQREAASSDHCIGKPILEAVEDPEGIALTAVDDGSVTWLEHSWDEELDS